jgi:hypothetical protein
VPRLNGDLPAGYGETRIVLLPVDPYLVHAYWEVAPGETKYVRALIQEGALRPQALLRFHDVTALPVGGVGAEGSFDVEIAIESRNWYVRLLSPERAYVVDLGFRGRDGRFHRIARSNRADTPRAWPCAQAGEQRMRVVEIGGVVHAEPPVPREDRRAVMGIGGGPPVPAVEETAGEAGPAPRQGDSLAFPDSKGGPNVRKAGTGEGVRPLEARRRAPSHFWRSQSTGTGEPDRVTLTAILGRKTEPPPGDAAPGSEAPAAERQAEGAPSSDSEEDRTEVPPRGRGPAAGPVEEDLSLHCERLFLSGLSSSRREAAPKGRGRR